ncbi:HAD family hydrolase [Pseudorhodobacter ferrugineus]|uniref:HAD family hydrolase n=1 Tax=Pseudorhodobacter ferrugineus TaxID=77008 RepID=UPI000404BA99|nr:HAD-IA family hydrolase [Pseudorhodobacter ferrugineus]
MIPTMTPRAILFDCDGVLVDSEAIAFDLLAEDLAAHGLHLTRAEMELRFLGGTIGGLFTTARGLGANLPDDWVDVFYARMYARLAQGTGLIDGVMDVLDALDRAGIVYGVGSNGSDQKMQITLGQHPAVMARLGGHLYSGQTLGCPKPEPGLWLHAARALGVDPADCVVIDDSPTGCIGAARAGMRCLGLAEHDDGARLAATGAEVIASLRDIPGKIGL